MKGIKKFLILIIAAFAAVCFTACGGSYNPPASSGNSGSSGGSGTVVQPTTPKPAEKEETADDESEYFTVRLVDSYGVPFNPYPARVTATWTNETSINTAVFSPDGVAKTKLDGNYQVTISGLPSGYTYDPNIYTATNYARDVSIIVLKLSSYTGTGSDKYNNIINLTHTGIYRATLTRADQTIYFQYRPTINGSYSFTSILDITADEVNPILDVYWGSFAWKPEKPTETVDGGGTSGIYTKNFRWEIQHGEENNGNVYAFGIRATSIKPSAFPITVDLILERDGEFTTPVTEYEVIEAKEINGVYANLPAGTWQSVANLSPDRRLLNGNKVKYNEADGYWHVYDSETGTFGETLYAKITVPTLSQDSENQFTNTLVALTLAVRDPDNKKDANGNVIYYYKNYTNFIRGENGYAKYVNSDGTYPVTQELKVFLQEFASCNDYFKDGEGLAEDYYDSSEKNMWLYACGYYA